MRQIHLFKEKTKVWPNDWDIHILNTFEFYFDDDNASEIFFYKGGSSYSSYIESFEKTKPSFREMRDNISITSIKTQIVLNLKGRYYNSYFVYKGGESIVGIVMKVMKFIGGEERVLIADPIDAFNGSTAYGCAERVEKIILNDNRDDDSDDEEFPEPSPVTGICSYQST